MQNGSAISEQLQKLRDIDAEWEQLIAKEGEPDRTGIRKKVRILIKILRQELKTGDEEEIKNYLLAQGVKEETVEHLVTSAQKMLELYVGFSGLREWEASSNIELKGLLDVIYQKYIVRYEPGYLEQIERRVEKWGKLREVAEKMEFLTDYYISRSYTRQKMIEDLQDETGLSQESCEYWAELIEQNYMALKMNYIVAGIDRIQMSLREMENSMKV